MISSSLTPLKQWYRLLLTRWNNYIVFFKPYEPMISSSFNPMRQWYHLLLTLWNNDIVFSKFQYPKAPHSTPRYLTVPCRYGDYKLAWLPSLPPLSDQLIIIKLDFLSMKIVQNYKENIFKSASDSTYIFLLKIKNSVCRFLYPLPPSIPQ